MAKQSIKNWEGRHKSLAFWWSVGFGAGLLRPAPGTWGSLLGIGLAVALLQLPFAAWSLFFGAVFVSLISIAAIGSIEKASGIHDAPEIVIDEVAGQWLAVLPLAFFPYGFGEIILSFALFRVFDIIKPWPIGFIDKHLSGGLGVMVDDLVAGIFAAILLLIYIQYVP